MEGEPEARYRRTGQCNAMRFRLRRSRLATMAIAISVCEHVRFPPLSGVRHRSNVMCQSMNWAVCSSVCSRTQPHGSRTDDSSVLGSTPNDTEEWSSAVASTFAASRIRWLQHLKGPCNGNFEGSCTASPLGVRNWKSCSTLSRGSPSFGTAPPSGREFTVLKLRGIPVIAREVVREKNWSSSWKILTKIRIAISCSITFVSTATR